MLSYREAEIEDFPHGVAPPDGTEMESWVVLAQELRKVRRDDIWGSHLIIVMREKPFKNE